MLYGIVQGTLGASPDEMFAVASRLGFDGLELYYGDTIPDVLDDDEARRRLLTAAQSAGIAIPSLMLGSLNRGGLAADDPAMQSRARAVIAGAIRLAPAIGASVVLIPFFFDAHPRDEAAVARVRAGLCELAPLAERANVTLAFEGQLPADAIVGLLDAIDSSAVRCYYDVGNAVWLGFDPVAELILLGNDRIAQVHFKDIRGHGSEALNDVMLGQGRMPLAAVAQTLHEMHYDRWLVLETRKGSDPVAAAAANLATLRRASSSDATIANDVGIVTA